MLIIIYSRILELYAGEHKKAIKWLVSSNPYFFDSSPLKLVLTGKSYLVIDFLNERLGR